MAKLKRAWADFLEEHHYVELVVSAVKYWLPPINYITIHYTYFILGCALSSLIFWASSAPFGSVSYVDSLYMVTSAFTNTGLNTVNISTLTVGQQVILFILMIIGSPIWVSLWTVLVRKRAFEKRFEDIVTVERDMRKKRATIRRAPALHNAMKLRTPENGRSTRSTTFDLESTLHPMQDTDVSNERSNLMPGSSSAVGQVSTVTQNNEGSSDNAPAIKFAQPPPPQTRQDDQLSFEIPPIRRRASTSSSASSSIDLEDFLFHWEKILGKHNVSRNGQFYDLNSEEREQIGGCEYRALKIFALTVPTYFVLWQVLGALALGGWMSTYAQERAAKAGVNPWWAGIFLSVSAFNNGGLSVFDDSLVSFGESYFLLFVIGLLVLAGNTAYPILLRFIFWSTLKLLNLTSPRKVHGPWKETLQFILKYPRRVYTTMFPSRATWWLLALLTLINSIDWVSFEVMNIGNPALETFSVGQRIMDGWFQSISVRAAGLIVFPLSSLYIGMQVTYLIMMYISVYPVVITMRSSNVYEERSLGIYNEEPDASHTSSQGPALNIQDHENRYVLPSTAEPNQGQFLRRRKTSAVINKTMKRAMTFNGVGVRAPNEGEENSRVNFISQQIRGQLAHDLWWLVLAVLIIVLIETSHFMRDPVTYSFFNVLFEGVSAYGCVGLSIGLPDQAYSFSGGCFVASKVVLTLVMLRGRHRGLPVAVDRAVRLPGDQLAKEEEEDSKIRRTKTMQRMS